MATAAVVAIREQVTAGNGVTYNVLWRKTPAQYEAEGKPHYANHLRWKRIVAEYALQRPRGNVLYMAFEWPSRGGQPYIVIYTRLR